MGFTDPIIGGAVKLIRNAIQSPNFITGVSGWTINKDGSAEFNNLTIRGVFRGTNFIVNSAGTFFYSGVPASGNLVASIASGAGTDGFGNAYKAGITTYSLTGQSVQHTSNRLFIENAGEFASAVMFLSTILSGIDALVLQSPSPTSPQTQAQLALVAGPLAGGSGMIQIANSVLNILQAVNPATPVAGTNLYVDAANKLVQVPQTGTPMQVPGTRLATFPNITATTVAATTISSGGIPANDAEIGSVYEIEVWGNGTWGSTAQTLTFGVSLGGTTLSSVTLAANYFVASTTFRFRVKFVVICHTTGVTGTWSSLISGEASAANMAGINTVANANTTTGGLTESEPGTTTTIDSTVAQTLAALASWGSATGAPTLTSRVAMFKRIA
jgi:hypothetical protein